jgi:osmotically-inducible protein OsmY
VESALKSEPDLHGAAISVRSQAGVVTLSGTAKDPQLRSMAAQVALSIEGVKLVRNDIALGQEA